MKIIVSHDVDHITFLEHKKDLIIPKLIVRNALELILRKISAKEYLCRFKDILQNRCNNIPRLMAYNRRHEIPSTFFIGVNRGMGLSYDLKLARQWINHIQGNGFDVGVHGISYEDTRAIEREFATFKQLSLLKDTGIRMHNLRLNDHTLGYLERTGYMFDSSINGHRDPFKIRNMWEFPLHIMDAHIFCGKARWQKYNLSKAKRRTEAIIDSLIKGDIEYLTVLFHDCYFSDSFLSWKNWYIWLIYWARVNHLKFISYREAIKELEAS